MWFQMSDMWYEVSGTELEPPKRRKTLVVRADSSRIARRRAEKMGMVPQAARLLPRYYSHEHRLCFSTFEEFKKALSAPLPSGICHLSLGFMDPYGPKVMKTLVASKHVGGIKEIQFGFQKITSSDLKELAKSTKLKGLNFVGFFRLLGDAVEALASSPFFKSLTSLQVVGEWGPTSDGLLALGHSPHLVNLEALTLNAKLGPTVQDLSNFAGSPLMRRLTCLDLGTNRWLGEKEIACLVSTDAVSRLTSLNLTQANIKAKGVKAMVASPNLANLEELHLWGNYIGPDGAMALAQSRFLKKLTHLNIGCNNIEDEGLAALAGSPIMNHVVSLGLSQNLIEEAGLRALIRSKHLAALRDMNLSHNKFGSQGCRTFQESDLAKQLDHLEIAGIAAEEVKGEISGGDSVISEELEEWLKRQRRWAWKPTTKKMDGSQLDSKFSGTPWLRAGESWPSCGNCQGPMHFFFQVDLDNLPKSKDLAFGHGMLQFFHCLKENCLYGKYCQDPFSPCLLLRIIEVAGKSAKAPIPDYERIPAFPSRTIVGWKKVPDFPSAPELPELGLTFDDYSTIECKEVGFVAEDVGFDDFQKLVRCVKGDKLAGWPDWVQIHTSYPKCRVCHERMDTVLFNLGCDDNIPFMFADGGHGPILQCPDHKDVLAFSWDSG